MGKNIVICSDGTWNTPDQKDKGIISPSNVAKMALAVASCTNGGTQQLLYYDSGVGTHWHDRLRGGISGWGISRNILQAYYFLMEHYEPGDRIFFFGFSRGAYTVRSVAGFLRNCGLLKKENRHMVHNAYKLYRRRDKESHPRAVEAELFRRTFSRETPVHFIGVWDTVGALGIPVSNLDLINKAFNLEFHDVELSSSIANAFQALAIDERRKAFEPCLWTRQSDVPGQRLEQVWFSGVHTNVGGGYKDSGLSDITLTWMSDRARECGLGLDLAPLQSLGITIIPKWNGVLEDSKKFLYKIVPDYIRPLHATPANQTRVSAEAWTRFEHDPAYAAHCVNLAELQRRAGGNGPRP